jgi:hypothetical protein
MTHDARLPTLEKIMNGNEFELVDSPWGSLPAWKVQGLAMGAAGALEALHHVYQAVRTDSADAASRADAEQARSALLKDVCEKLDTLTARFDALTARLAEAEDKRRADEARARRFDEEPVVLPPDLATRQASSPPSKIEDDTDETHHPSGDLHSVAPKEEPSEDEPSELPEPPLEDSDNVGDLPEELQLGEPSGPPESKGHIYQQPTAISLNEA